MKNEQLENDNEKLSINYLDEKTKIVGMLDKLKIDSYRKDEFKHSKYKSTPSYLEALEIKRFDSKIELSSLENDIMKLNEFKQSSLVIWTILVAVLLSAAPKISDFTGGLFNQFSDVFNIALSIFMTISWLILTLGSLAMVVAFIGIYGDVTGKFSLQFGVINYNKTQQNILEQNICKLTIELINERIKDQEYRINENISSDLNNSNVVIRRNFKKEGIEFSEYLSIPKSKLKNK